MLVVIAAFYTCICACTKRGYRGLERRARGGVSKAVRQLAQFPVRGQIIYRTNEGFSLRRVTQWLSRKQRRPTIADDSSTGYIMYAIWAVLFCWIASSAPASLLGCGCLHRTKKRPVQASDNPAKGNRAKEGRTPPSCVR